MSTDWCVGLVCEVGPASSSADAGAHACVPESSAHAPFRGTDARDRGLLTARQLAGETWRAAAAGRVRPPGRGRDTTEVRLAAVELAVPADAVITGQDGRLAARRLAPAARAAVPWTSQRAARARAAPARGATGRHVATCLADWCCASDVDEVGGLLVTLPDAYLLRPDSASGPSSRRSSSLDAFAFAGLIDLPDRGLPRRAPRLARRSRRAYRGQARRPPRGPLRRARHAPAWSSSWPASRAARQRPARDAARGLAPDLMLSTCRVPAGSSTTGRTTSKSWSTRIDLRRENDDPGRVASRCSAMTATRCLRERERWSAGRAYDRQRPRQTLDDARLLSGGRRPVRW